MRIELFRCNVLPAYDKPAGIRINNKRAGWIVCTFIIGRIV